MAFRRGGSPAHAAQETYLRRSTKMIRHAAIRRLLAGRYHSRGITSLNQMRDELEAASGIKSHIMTLSIDLREMGAIKVRDAERPSIEWWVIPAFNPNVEDLREHMDADHVEAEVAHKITMHVIDIAPIHNLVYVMTESRAGPLVGYWISWLNWVGIIYVQEQLDGCIIHCLNDEIAINIAESLMGDTRLRERDEEGEGDDDGEDEGE